MQAVSPEGDSFLTVQLKALIEDMPSSPSPVPFKKPALVRYTEPQALPGQDQT